MMMLNSGGGALCRSLLIGARSFATTVSSTSTSTSTSTTSDTTFISRSYSRSSSSSISSSTYNRLSTSSNNNNNPCIFNHHTFFTSRFYSTVIIDRPTTTTTSTSSSSNNNNNNLNNPSFRMRYQQNNKDRKDKNRKGKNDNKQDKEGKQEETTTTKERRILANGALRYSREELKTIGFLDFESNCFLLGDLDMIAQELKRYLAVHIGNGRVAHQMIRLHRLDETQKYPMVVDREEVAALFRRSLHCLAQRMRDFAHYSPQTTYVPGTRTVEPLTPEKAQMKQDHLAVLAIQKKAMETIFAYFSKYGKDMRFLDYFIQNALNRHSVPLDELIRTLRDADDFESVYRVYDLCVENKIVISTPSAQIILERMLHERPNEIPKLIAYVMNSKPANFALLYIYNEMIGNYLVLDLFEQFLLTLVRPETQFLLYNYTNAMVSYYLIEGNYSQALAHLGRSAQHYNTPPHYTTSTIPLVWNAVISTLGNTNQTERLLQVRRNFEGQYFIYTVAAIESFARHMYTLGRWSDPEILPFYSTANLHIPRSIRPQLIRLQQCEIEHLLSLNKINEAYSLFKTIKSPNNAILSTIFKVIEMKFGNNDNYESLSKKLINHITPIVVGTKQQNQNVVKEEEENQEKESNSTSTSTSTSTTTFRNQSFGITWGAFYRLFFERLLKNDRADLINHYISQHPEYFKGATVSKAVVHLMINAQLTPHDKIRVFLEHYTPLWTRCSDDLHACLLKAYEQLAPNDRDPSVLQKLESFKIYKEDPDSFDKHEIASIFYYNLNFIDTKFINNQVINTKAIHKEKYFEMRNLRQSIEDHQNMKDKKLNTSNSNCVK
ncbi:hypothetical protein DFA_10692 [Cavenderia fasciculata]|uniref:Uncharacterized protein n=1 Tax=Cavenderia fasciculata TaxID=261658 RepID=F4QB47_CACFS|nr:uncharacterized protein DFA_10692 [Cavenderia fasciculata]EGG14819.1 hypothetical protein DFA_10692 [Cavenderia fasciculata]|eukprot:XP_004351335.1 hypothetical protein DFA_10692 [Cavenderia fasciculata]